jgi:hypothetical protein
MKKQIEQMKEQAPMVVQTLDPFVKYNSDIVELDRCDVSKRKEIYAETEHLLQTAIADTLPTLNESLPALFHSEGNNAHHNRTYDDYLTDMRDEYALQLLELKLMERGQCNFSQYRPTVHDHETQGIQLQQAFATLYRHQPSLSKPFRFVKAHHRLAIVISAFKDFAQLASLLKAVHLPQHYIVIHIDRHCNLDYKAQLEALLATTPEYGNVVIVQFGSVVYTSDTISLINLRILRWLTFDLGLDYEHAFLMDGLAYPLRSPQEMVDYLQVQSTKHNGSVWLGLMHTDYFDYSSEQRPAPNAERLITLASCLPGTITSN